MLPVGSNALQRGRGPALPTNAHNIESRRSVPFIIRNARSRIAQLGSSWRTRWHDRQEHSPSHLPASAGDIALQAASQAPQPAEAEAGSKSTPGNGSGSDTFGSTLPRFNVNSLTAPLTWGYMLTYLTGMLLVPIIAMLVNASKTPWDVFLARATEPVAMSAYEVTFSMAFAACVFNSIFGFLLAWVLVKYNFPGKKWIDAAVDLPFALPTSVAGLTLTTVYAEEGILGALLTQLGINVVFSKLGVAVAMVFVSFPFVVRTMQPVLQEMEREVEEAAWTLGASPWKTFVQVLLPPLVPALLTGTALAFSRALGEFGSVVIISSNFPFKDLIAPVLIFQCLEQYDFVGATVIGTVLLLISLAIMMCVNWLQAFSQRYRR